MKNFTTIIWNEALAKQDWSRINKALNIDKKSGNTK